MIPGTSEPEENPAEGAWIEGRFEGIYAGALVHEQRDGARRYRLRVERGTLSDARIAPPPTAALRTDAEAHRQDRLAPVRVPAIPALERCQRPRETALFDVHLTEIRLRHPAERNGRGFGTLEGTLRARLAPETRGLPEVAPAAAEDEPEAPGIDPQDAGPELDPELDETAPLDHRVDGADVATVIARFQLWVALFAFALVAAAMAGLCSPRTAGIWGAGILAASATRRIGRGIAVEGRRLEGWLGGALVVAQLAGLLSPLESTWQSGCRAAIREDLLWIGAPMVLAALLRSPNALVATMGVWTLVLCVWCTQLDGGPCATAVAPAEASAEASASTSSPSPRRRTDAAGRWPASPGALPFAGAANPGGGLSATSGPSDGLRLAPNAPPLTGLGAPGRGATLPAPEAFDPGRAEAGNPGRVAQIPGGWVAPDHRRSHRELTLISVEQANRTPETFFESEGQRRVYQPTDPLFVDGTARWRSSADLDLNRLAAVLSRQPNRRVVLEVHTDSAGGAEGGQSLARARASALQTWLLERGHLSADRFAVEAVGGVYPLVPPDGSYAAQQPNRRIEVRLVRPSPTTEAPLSRAP